MKPVTGNVVHAAVIVGCLLTLTLTLTQSSLAQSNLAQENKTVIGPSNLELQEGADALRDGRVDEGIRLTEIGLVRAHSERERQTGNSNLCAGHALRGAYDTALEYCNKVLEENDRHWRAHSNRALVYIKLKRLEEAQQDLSKAEAISPNSNTVQAVRRMYLDAINPVVPSVIIDDRRQPAEDSGDADEI